MDRLADRTWPEIDSPGVVVPIGSLEQHGPHLPLDTDTVIARAAATELARRLEPGSLVAPALEYGASGEHAEFPGTISIGTPALRRVVVELVRSLQWSPWVVLVNGHGGNVEAVSEAVVQLRDEGHHVVWVPCAVPAADAHAGRTETSLMLHLDPARVLLHEAVAGNVKPIGELLPVLRKVGVRPLSPSGVLGDPDGASAFEGRALFEQMVDDQLTRLAGGRADLHGMLA